MASGIPQQQAFPGHNLTAEEVAKGHDLTGKNVIVTGGYTGIGKETCRVLGLHNANVFVVGRNMEKGNKAVEDLKKQTGKNNFTAMEADLASLASVRSFAEQFNKLNLPLHYLILNAGIMACPYAKTADGFEMQFGTNVVGHFLLTQLLLPRLIQAAPSRVISVSSAGHAMHGVRFDDPNFEKGDYHPFTAYGQSKTGNILFAQELNRLYKDKGVTASSLHPGAIHDTELGRHVDIEDFKPENMAKIPGIEKVMAYNINQKTTPQGAATTVYCTLSPNVTGGKFYFDCHEAEPVPHATSQEAATKLWEICTKLTGL